MEFDLKYLMGALSLLLDRTNGKKINIQCMTDGDIGIKVIDILIDHMVYEWRVGRGYTMYTESDDRRLPRVKDITEEEFMAAAVAALGDKHDSKGEKREV